MIPGMNVLNMALGVIQPQGVQWMQFVSSVTNAAGKDVPTYAAPLPISGSVQDVDAQQMQKLGLDMLKTYVYLFTSNNVQPVGRDSFGDRIVWRGFQWSCESTADWIAQDGWAAILCVKVPAL